ncbi:zinc phosphodiesterase ELAC protein 2-like [Eurytemora carolleeae]|uniref:zinc phosphodiesterase ELAC protein 2-like n=1 Tax=Eurytemora carolleeae TaxID=1294199 RepID=UPI000C7701E1|nr:zinc phosphodiesterase ELAC protein 2-like [Eurytemora carolleeae]|eukprot:XP_023347836.1 zinc phosphodiesterase ELAC protein 2-like [Eurytemora affinis]
MEAKFTLLTHFSQRYSKIPLLDEIQGKENVGIAFDNMVVNPVSMRTIPGLYPALKRIFHSEVREMEEKTLILHFNNVEKTQCQT